MMFFGIRNAARLGLDVRDQRLFITFIPPATGQAGRAVRDSGRLAATAGTRLCVTSTIVRKPAVVAHGSCTRLYDSPWRCAWLARPRTTRPDRALSGGVRGSRRGRPLFPAAGRASMNTAWVRSSPRRSTSLIGGEAAIGVIGARRKPMGWSCGRLPRLHEPGQVGDHGVEPGAGSTTARSIPATGG
jgi:hypothetical protein